MTSPAGQPVVLSEGKHVALFRIFYLSATEYVIGGLNFVGVIYLGKFDTRTVAKEIPRVIRTGCVGREISRDAIHSPLFT